MYFQRKSEINIEFKLRVEKTGICIGKMQILWGTYVLNAKHVEGLNLHILYNQERI